MLPHFCLLLIAAINLGFCNILYTSGNDSSYGGHEERDISRIALQMSSGCHFVAVTHGQENSAVPFVLRSCYLSLHPLVLVDIDAIDLQKMSQKFTRDLWGSFTFTCRAMLIDFTGNATSNILKFLETIRLRWWPETRILIIGRRYDVQSLLQHSSFKNSLHVLFMGVRESSPSSEIISPKLWKVRTQKNGNSLVQSQGYFLHLFSRCLYCNRGQPGLRRIFLNLDESKSSKLYLSLSEQLDNLYGAQLHVVSIPYFPYSNFKLDSHELATTVIFLDSIDIRAFDAFCSLANFSYVVRVPKDRIPGVVDSNGTWNGAFGVLQREEADLTSAAAIYDEKLKISDYVRVYIMDQFIIVSLKPQELPRYLVLIRPFEAAVWVSILLCIIVWGISLWAVQKAYSSFATEEAMSLTTTLFYSTATFLEDPPSRLPVNFPGQILVVWWLVVCLLLSTAYRSSLVAHLTVQGKTKPIDDYYDLVSKEKWQWGCDRIVLYGIAASYFRKSTTPVVKQISKQVESVDIEDGLERVLKGQYSLLTSRNRIRTVIESKYANNYGQTPFYLSKRGYYLSTDLGWSFRKGSPIRPRFAQLANRLIEGGLIDYWLRDVMALNIKRNRKQQNEQGKPDSKEENNNVDEGKVILRMEHLIGVFLTFQLGIFISSFVFLVEKLLGRLCWSKN